MSYLRLECTKFDFSWGGTPDPDGVAHLQHPKHPGWILRGPTSKRGRTGLGRRGKEGDKGEGGSEGEPGKWEGERKDGRGE